MVCASVKMSGETFRKRRITIIYRSVQTTYIIPHDEFAAPTQLLWNHDGLELHNVHPRLSTRHTVAVVGLLVA